MLGIRRSNKLDPDPDLHPHQSYKLDPDPVSINLQMTSQNVGAVWYMILFEHLFQGIEPFFGSKDPDLDTDRRQIEK